MFALTVRRFCFVPSCDWYFDDEGPKVEMAHGAASIGEFADVVFQAAAAAHRKYWAAVERVLEAHFAEHVAAMVSA